MKRIRFAVFLMLSLLIICTFSFGLLKISTFKLCENFKEIELLASNSDWSNAERITIESEKYWFNIKKSLSVFMYDSNLQKVDCAWGEVKFCFEKRDFVALKFQLEQLKNELDYICSSEVPNWFTILSAFV